MVTCNPLDLTEGLLGKEVPKTSNKVRWKDGHTSILPAVYDQYQINVCNSVDIPMINYLAESSSSTPASNYVLHLTNNDLGSDEILDRVEGALGNNRPVVIRGVEHQPPAGEFTPDYLDKHFGISPNRAVYIHGISAFELEYIYFSDQRNRCRGSCCRSCECYEAWYYCVFFCIDHGSKEDPMYFGPATCPYDVAAVSQVRLRFFPRDLISFMTPLGTLITVFFMGGMKLYTMFQQHLTYIQKTSL